MAPLRRAGRDRLPVVRQDIFLQPELRLTEQERALMIGMLHRLVADIATEIQSSLPYEWLPANEDHQDLIHRLSSTGLFDIEELIALILRRVDEERVSAAVRARSGGSVPLLIQPLVSDRNADVAAAAMAVLIARGRRRDRFGRGMVEIDDVPPAAAASLVYAVAAGLLEKLPVQVDVTTAEQHFSDAGRALLATHDPQRSLDESIRRLVDVLLGTADIGEQLIRRAMDAGELTFVAHAIAHRTNLEAAAAFDELMSGDSRRVMLLFRLAGLPRAAAAHLLACLGDLIGISAHDHALRSFDELSGDRVRSAGGWLQLDPAFRDALRKLGTGDGNGSD